MRSLFKTKNSTTLFAAALFLSCGSIFLFMDSPSAWSSSQPNCDINRGPCSIKADETEIVFDITPKPVKAMQELTFTVTISDGVSADHLTITLEMPEMYMGENKVVTRKSAKGTYTGQGVIPRCHIGKKLWRAKVETPSGRKAVFLFDVVY